jgi:hypothetical protein
MILCKKEKTPDFCEAIRLLYASARFSKQLRTQTSTIDLGVSLNALYGQRCPNRALLPTQNKSVDKPNSASLQGYMFGVPNYMITLRDTAHSQKRMRRSVVRQYVATGAKTLDDYTC